MDGNCTSLEPNTDISGIGVRVSFYAQAICLALLSARSVSSIETSSALSTLIITNLAYSVTTLALGFKDDPDITLYDALIVMYLLTLSWMAIFFALPQYNRYKSSDAAVKYLAIVQSLLLFVTGIAILSQAKSFGRTPQCNFSVEAFIFHSFHLINGGRIAFLVLLCIAMLSYTVLVYWDLQRSGRYSPQAKPDMDYEHDGSLDFDKDRAEIQRRKDRRKCDGKIIVMIIFILAPSVIIIFNTEMTRRANNPKRGDDTRWSFGQVLPVFLAILPCWNTMKAFFSHGFGPKQRKRSMRQQKRSGRLTAIGPV